MKLKDLFEKELKYNSTMEWKTAAKGKGYTVKDADTKNQPGAVKTIMYAYDRNGKEVGHLNMVNGGYMVGLLSESETLPYQKSTDSEITPRFVDDWMIYGQDAKNNWWFTSTEVWPEWTDVKNEEGKGPSDMKDTEAYEWMLKLLKNRNKHGHKTQWTNMNAWMKKDPGYKKHPEQFEKDWKEMEQANKEGTEKHKSLITKVWK